MAPFPRQPLCRRIAASSAFIRLLDGTTAKLPDDRRLPTQPLQILCDDGKAVWYNKRVMRELPSQLLNCKAYTELAETLISFALDLPKLAALGMNEVLDDFLMVKDAVAPPPPSKAASPLRADGAAAAKAAQAAVEAEDTGLDVGLAEQVAAEARRRAKAAEAARAHADAHAAAEAAMAEAEAAVAELHGLAVAARAAEAKNALAEVCALAEVLSKCAQQIENEPSQLEAYLLCRMPHAVHTIESENGAPLPELYKCSLSSPSQSERRSGAAEAQAAAAALAEQLESLNRGAAATQAERHLQSKKIADNSRPPSAPLIVDQSWGMDTPIASQRNNNNQQQAIYIAGAEDPFDDDEDDEQEQEMGALIPLIPRRAYQRALGPLGPAILPRWAWGASEAAASAFAACRPRGGTRSRKSGNRAAAVIYACL